MPLPGGYLLDTNVLVHLLRDTAMNRPRACLQTSVCWLLPRSSAIKTVESLCTLCRDEAMR